MDRVNGLGFVLDANGHRVFVDENLAAGIDGTDVPAVWLTAVQEELQTIQAAAGLAPDAANFGQVLQALQQLFTTAAVAQQQASQAEDSAIQDAVNKYLNRLTGGEITGPVTIDGTATVNFLTGKQANLNIGGGTVQITNGDGSALNTLILLGGTVGNQATSIAQFQLSTYGIAGFPGGSGQNLQFQMQFATLSVPADSTAHAYSLPTSFAHACLGIVISFGAETPPPTGSVGAQPQNQSSFIATCTAPGNGGAGYGVYIWAWGY